MSDSYQPIYDAIRSRLSNCDVGTAVENVMRDCNFSHYAEMAKEAISHVAWEYGEPSVLFRPNLKIDGDQWCALYGDNLQDGVAGFGDSPAKAMADFNKNWLKALETP